jgi:uncharacterized HAD superfamily protein
MIRHIGVDADDSLLDTIPHTLAFFNMVKNRFMMVKHLTEYPFNHLLGSSYDEAERLFCALYQNPLLNVQIQPKMGAAEAIQVLRKKYKLSVVTARPEEVRSALMQTLDTHFSDSFAKVHMTRSLSGKNVSKAGICIGYDIDVLIDDAPHTLNEVAECGIRGILLPMPWNKNVVLHKNITRAHNWNHVVEIIKRDG